MIKSNLREISPKLLTQKGLLARHESPNEGEGHATYCWAKCQGLLAPNRYRRKGLSCCSVLGCWKANEVYNQLPESVAVRACCGFPESFGETPEGIFSRIGSSRTRCITDRLGASRRVSNETCIDISHR